MANSFWCCFSSQSEKNDQRVPLTRRKTTQPVVTSFWNKLGIGSRARGAEADKLKTRNRAHREEIANKYFPKIKM